MPPKVAVAVFDAAVNQGNRAAAMPIQKAVGVPDDGVIGPRTLAAIAKADEDELVIQFLGWRLRRCAFTNNAATYMRGWANRVLYLQQFLHGLKVAICGYVTSSWPLSPGGPAQRRWLPA